MGVSLVIANEFGGLSSSTWTQSEIKDLVQRDKILRKAQADRRNPDRYESLMSVSADWRIRLEDDNQLDSVRTLAALRDSIRFVTIPDHGGSVNEI